MPATTNREFLDVAVDNRDFWALMTLAGLPNMDRAADAATVAGIVERVGGLHGRRIADLGSGCGRFSVEFLRHDPADLLALEQSTALAGMSRGLHPEVPVAVDSFSNLAAYGSFDVVMAMSHLLFITETPKALLADLRHIRAAMPDYGLLVVEQFVMDTTPREWDTISGIRIVEHTTATDGSTLKHAFDVYVDDRHVLDTQMPSLVMTDHEIEHISREAGFLVTDFYTEAANDGQLSRFWILRAQKGFNYLSDLDEFLESWLTAAHERNSTTRSIVLDENGRVRPTGTVAWGQGASLSRNHPEFVDCLEPAIKPLVLELVEGWGLVTYSSCDGHVVASDPREDYSESYVGVLTFSEDHLRAITTLLETAVRTITSDALQPMVRHRDLLGPRHRFSVVDLLLTRRDASIPWSRYQSERDRCITRAVVALGETRVR